MSKFMSRSECIFVLLGLGLGLGLGVTEVKGGAIEANIIEETGVGGVSCRFIGISAEEAEEEAEEEEERLATPLVSWNLCLR